MSSSVNVPHEIDEDLMNQPDPESPDISAEDMDQIQATLEQFQIASPSSPSKSNRQSCTALDSPTIHTTTSSPTKAESQRRVTVSSSAAEIRSRSDHHKPIVWEQPEWAKQRRLRPTSAATLALDAAKPSKAIEWEKPEWAVKPILKESSSGRLAKIKGDLQKPITKATDKELVRGTLDDFNAEANPAILRPTEKGSAVRLGQNLAKSITMVEKDPFADVNFEANPEFVLRETPVGQAVKQGTSLSKPVTHCYKPESQGINFDANPSLHLKPTIEGKLAKTKGDLQKPITAATIMKSEFDSLNFEANQMILKPTEKGSLVRLGEKLERPITHINDVLRSSSHPVDDSLHQSSQGGDSVEHEDRSTTSQDEIANEGREDEQDTSNHSHSRGQWEEFGSSDGPSHSDFMEQEDLNESQTVTMGIAFNNSFGHDSKGVVVDS